MESQARKGQPRSEKALVASPVGGPSSSTLTFYRKVVVAYQQTSPHNTNMALARPLPPIWQTLLPTLTQPTRPLLNPPLLHQLTQPFRNLRLAPFAIPSLALPSIPSLAEIWDGLLKAVPKKKTSHRKKRQRFMAGKGLKDVTALTRCSACGRVKRAHILCPYCVDGALNHKHNKV